MFRLVLGKRTKYCFLFPIKPNWISFLKDYEKILIYCFIDKKLLKAKRFWFIKSETA